MTIMHEESVKLSVEGIISEIIINRPKDLNALNPDVLQSLLIIFDKLEKRGDVRAVIITGAGEKAFVAGADIKSMIDLGPRPIADYVELGQRVMRRIESFGAPVIAAVNGYALGGGFELALACDLIVAAAGAKLGLPEVKLGIAPGFGGTQRLALRTGIGVARRLIFTGDFISSEEALSLMVVDKVVPPETLLEEARSLARVISERAPLAVRKAKELIRKGSELALLSGMQLEVEGFLELFKSADREEGMKAFLQNRPPVYKGN